MRVLAAAASAIKASTRTAFVWPRQTPTTRNQLRSSTPATTALARIPTQESGTVIYRAAPTPTSGLGIRHTFTLIARDDEHRWWRGEMPCEARTMRLRFARTRKRVKGWVIFVAARDDENFYSWHCVISNMTSCTCIYFSLRYQCTQGEEEIRWFNISVYMYLGNSLLPSLDWKFHAMQAAVAIIHNFENHQVFKKLCHGRLLRYIFLELVFYAFSVSLSLASKCLCLVSFTHPSLRG